MYVLLKSVFCIDTVQVDGFDEFSRRFEARFPNVKTMAELRAHLRVTETTQLSASAKCAILYGTDRLKEKPKLKTYQAYNGCIEKVQNKSNLVELFPKLLL